VEPLFLWYAVAPLAIFVVLMYMASRAYDGWLWGFLFVVGSLWLHVAVLAAVDLLTGGLLSRAFDMGFDVYVKVERAPHRVYGRIVSLHLV